MPGSPDREQLYDQNDPESRVLLKAGAWERVNSALRAFLRGDWREPPSSWNERMDVEAARSYAWVLGLVAQAEAKSAEHRLATRHVLMNTNNAGGWQEMERLETLGQRGRKMKEVLLRESKAEFGGLVSCMRWERKWCKVCQGLASTARMEADGPAAKTIAKKCREIVAYVLDRLDERSYWLGWGLDVEVVQRREAAADRRLAGVLATKEDAHRAIEAYYKLMRQTDRAEADAEVATMKHFQCSSWKVRTATKAYRDSLKEEVS